MSNLKNNYNHIKEPKLENKTNKNEYYPISQPTQPHYLPINHSIPPTMPIMTSYDINSSTNQYRPILPPHYTPTLPYNLSNPSTLSSASIPLPPHPYPPYMLPPHNQAAYYPQQYYMDPMNYYNHYNAMYSQVYNHDNWTNINNSQAYPIPTGHLPSHLLAVNPIEKKLGGEKKEINNITGEKRKEGCLEEHNNGANNKQGGMGYNTKGGEMRELGSVNLYKKVSQIGEGTYGKVYKGLNQRNNEYVALKALRLEKEKDGFPITATREIKLLQNLKNENIVQLLEMFTDNESVYMVFEYMDYDLAGFLAHPNVNLNEDHIRHLMLQLFNGLQFLHKKKVAHRDLKGSNLLLNKKGQLKIADFGLARILNHKNNMDYTNRVITLWYRPPELLLGSTNYNTEVDMWGAGCIMMELLKGKALFPGMDEFDQLDKIYSIMGTPNVSDWPEIVDLPWYQLIKVKNHYQSKFMEICKNSMSDSAFDLVSKLLMMDPKKRICALEASKHDFFKIELKEDVFNFPGLEGDWHEFEYKAWKKGKLINQHKKVKQQDLSINDSLNNSTNKDTKDINIENVSSIKSDKISTTAPQSITNSNEKEKEIDTNLISNNEIANLINKEITAAKLIEKTNKSSIKDTLLSSTCIKEALKIDTNINIPMNSGEVSTEISNQSTPKLPSRNPPTPPPPPPPPQDQPPLPNTPPPKAPESSDEFNDNNSFEEFMNLPLQPPTKKYRNYNDREEDDLNENDSLIETNLKDIVLDYKLDKFNNIDNNNNSYEINLSNIGGNKKEMDEMKSKRFFPQSYNRKLLSRSRHQSPTSITNSPSEGSLSDSKGKQNDKNKKQFSNSNNTINYSLIKQNNHNSYLKSPIKDNYHSNYSTSKYNLTTTATNNNKSIRYDDNNNNNNKVSPLHHRRHYNDYHSTDVSYTHSHLSSSRGRSKSGHRYSTKPTSYYEEYQQENERKYRDYKDYKEYKDNNYHSHSTYSTSNYDTHDTRRYSTSIRNEYSNNNNNNNTSIRHPLSNSYYPSTSNNRDLRSSRILPSREDYSIRNDNHRDKRTSKDYYSTTINNYGIDNGGREYDRERGRDRGDDYYKGSSYQPPYYSSRYSHRSRR